MRPVSTAVRDPAQSLRVGAGSYIYSHDPRQLEREVSQACEGARSRGESEILRALVADLDFSAVHPAAATQALLKGNCGGVSDVVEEMVAQGGREALDAVVERARMIEGERASRQIESAAAAGLARRTGLAEVEQGLAQEDPPSYGMLYFPSVAEGSKLVTAVALNRLYEEAIPGYGIYTFVLSGRGFTHPRGEDVARYSEFFRMLETYVSAADGEDGGPSAEAHVFLVPINPERIGTPLVDQSAADLADVMRRHLIQTLRHEGHRALAARLDKGAGPFLVATLEPSLLPSDSTVPWLITDLSDLGPENVYGVVDAFDRPIPAEMSGRPESLSLIRERLLGLPVRAAGNQGVKVDASTWVFMLGDFA